MERNLLIFICLLVACAAGAIFGAIAHKFSPLTAFTAFAIPAGIWLGLTDKKRVGEVQP